MGKRYLLLTGTHVEGGSRGSRVIDTVRGADGKMIPTVFDSERSDLCEAFPNKFQEALPGQELTPGDANKLPEAPVEASQAAAPEIESAEVELEGDVTANFASAGPAGFSVQQVQVKKGKKTLTQYNVIDHGATLNDVPLDKDEVEQFIKEQV